MSNHIVADNRCTFTICQTIRKKKVHNQCPNFLANWNSHIDLERWGLRLSGTGLNFVTDLASCRVVFLQNPVFILPVAQKKGLQISWTKNFNNHKTKKM